MWRIESHDEPRNARLGSNLITSWKPGSIYFVVGIVQHGLMGHDDPTFCQEIFDISEAQAEAVVEPNAVADDFRREPVSAVAGGGAIHPASLPDPPLNLTIPVREFKRSNCARCG